MKDTLAFFMALFLYLDRGGDPVLLMNRADNRAAGDNFKFGPVKFVGPKTRPVVPTALSFLTFDDFI